MRGRGPALSCLRDIQRVSPMAARGMGRIVRRLRWITLPGVLFACGGDSAESVDRLPATIMLEEAFSLGSAQDPITPDLASNFAVTDSYVIACALPGIVHLFSHDGEYVREMDRRGDGPREFRGMLIPIPEGGDRVTLLDRETGRYLSMDLAADSVLEAGAVESPMGDAIPVDDGWVGIVGRGEGSGHDIVHATRSGDTRSLLPPGVADEFVPDIPAGEIISDVPPAVASVNGAVIFSPGHRYALTALDEEAPDGLRRIREDPEFFSGEWRSTPTGPVFRARITRLAPGPEGRLWVVSLIPRSDAGSDPRDIFTTWVELVDIESGEVFARSRLPGVASMTPVGEWLYEFGEQRGASSPVHFHRLRVEEPASER